MLPPIRMH